MKVVAFLQCQWFRDPERAKKTLARYEAHGSHGREAFLRDMLFLGCLTGKRNVSALKNSGIVGRFFQLR